MALRTDRLVEGHRGPRLQERRQLGLVGGEVVTSRDLEHVEHVHTWRGPRLRSSYSMDHRQEFWDQIRTESKGRESSGERVWAGPRVQLYVCRQDELRDGGRPGHVPGDVDGKVQAGLRPVTLHTAGERRWRLAVVYLR